MAAGPPAKRHVSQSLEMFRRVTPNALPAGHARRTPGYAVMRAAAPLRVTQDAIDSPRLRGRGRKGVSPPFGCRGQGALALLRNGHTARGGAEILSAAHTDTAPEPATSRDWQRHVEVTLAAAADPSLRNGMSANRGVAVRGSRAEAGLPVRAAQPLRPASPPHIIMVPSQRVGRRSIEAAPNGRAEAGSSSADPVPPDCSAAAAEPDHNAAGSARSCPAAA